MSDLSPYNPAIMGNLPPVTFKLQRIRGQTFEKQKVYLSGVRYEDCKFIDCTLVYLGGPGEMSKCSIYPGTIWEFEGPAATVVETLQRYGFRFLFGTESPEEPIRFPSGL